jgi:hypothetical protein
MCAEHEATTKTQPRNGIRIRCHDDDLRFETIIASKSTTPAIQSRPTSVPSEAPWATGATADLAPDSGSDESAQCGRKGLDDPASFTAGGLVNSAAPPPGD